MPFVDSAESIRSKVHATDANTPVLVGVLVVAGLAFVLFAGNVVSAANGAVFQVRDNATAADGSLPVTLGSSEAVNRSVPDGGGGVSSDASDSMTGAPAGASSSESRPVDVYVFVSGAVVNPGVYILESGSRVGDAVDAAGGFAEGASVSYNNLARQVTDGEQIHVPSEEEVLEAGGNGSGHASLVESAVSDDANAVASTLVNINTATAEELEALPGIGPATASKIVASRESEGLFSSIEDITRVSGIGEKKYESIQGLICV